MHFSINEDLDMTTAVYFWVNFGHFATPDVFLSSLSPEISTNFEKKCLVSLLLVCNFTEFGFSLFTSALTSVKKLRF